MTSIGEAPASRNSGGTTYGGEVRMQDQPNPATDGRLEIVVRDFLEQVILSPSIYDIRGAAVTATCELDGTPDGARL